MPFRLDRTPSRCPRRQRKHCPTPHEPTTPFAGPVRSPRRSEKALKKWELHRRRVAGAGYRHLMRTCEARFRKDCVSQLLLPMMSVYVPYKAICGKTVREQPLLARICPLGRCVCLHTNKEAPTHTTQTHSCTSRGARLYDVSCYVFWSKRNEKPFEAARTMSHIERQAKTIGCSASY